jgi:predicted NAD/FAD-dependent oxidoreductase
MRIAVIGAGAAGLAAARGLRLRRPDIEVVVFEQSRGLGGRAATRRRDGFTFDHGAQVIKAPTPAVERLLHEELPAGDLRRVELPVWVFDAAGRIAPGDPALNAETSYCYRDGNDRLGTLLAEGLDVRREVRIASLARTENSEPRTENREPRTEGDRSGSWFLVPGSDTRRWLLRDTDGRQIEAADAVLLTAPAAQSAEIVAAGDLDAALKARVAAELGRAGYWRCVSLALAYDRPLERQFYALVNADRAHPVAWLGLEHAKTPGRCPPGHSLLIAQMAPAWSLDRWDAPADVAAAEVAAMVGDLLGEDLARPLWCDRQGWRYALPDSGCDAESAEGDGLFFAGDFAAGQGRVHLAIESGWRAADRIAAFLAPA